MTAPEATDPTVLEQLAYNIFLPPKLPQEELDESRQRSVDLAILRSVIQAGEEYLVRSGANPEWCRVEPMLQHLHQSVKTPIDNAKLSKDIETLKPKDFLTLFIRAQNVGMIIRRQVGHTTFEVFEVQARAEDVMSVPEKIIRHFPGSMIRVPDPVARDKDFIKELSNILVQTSKDTFDKAVPKTQKAGTEVRETRDSINPNYFIQYFFGFLRGMGTIIDPPRTVKRLADEVLWKDAEKPWRRSPIWLIIRVALQTSLDSTITYKHFMAFYHARVLVQCSKCDAFSSDLLFAMRVKMARRVYKLQATAPPFLVDTINDVAEEVQSLLQGRWDAVQSTHAQRLDQECLASNLAIASAVNQTLPNSSNYLRQVFEGRTSDSSPTGFSTAHSPRLENIAQFSQYANDGLSQAFKNDPALALFDFEASVFNNLATWTSIYKQQDHSGGCSIIDSCFRQYFVAAKSYYTIEVADQSIMMLTLMRLWMAIDELATNECPLLSRFSPELPENILDLLLLRTAQHIEQARVIQRYIRGRRAGATGDNPSIFSDKIGPKSFAVQFFNTSSRHQILKTTIDTNAREQKQKKIKELEDLNAQHEQLSEEIQGMAHNFIEVPREERQHSPYCKRCDKEKERDGLTIQPYEWPLPRSKPAAKAVVFELDRPESFIIWRDLTYKILVDLGALSPRSACDQRGTLEDHSPLSSWLVTPSGMKPRIIIASVTKSFKRSHYNYLRKIPAEESQVCLNNALQFRLYDRDEDTWASGPFPNVTLAKFGTMKLPQNSLYRHLGYCLENTTHTSNQVLSDQHDCPNELSLHEHIAFGTLRSGARLQWMNIVRGLEEDLLTFSSDEVRLLHSQAAWQIGPLSDNGSREWHQDLASLDFGRLLVSQCMRMLSRVKANWLQANSVSIIGERFSARLGLTYQGDLGPYMIVTLVNRLLASLPSAEVSHAAYSFLRAARAVAYQWLNELLVKLQTADREDVLSYQYRICEMAAICRATYDVESQHFDRLLSTSDDYATLIECSIHLHDNQPPNIKTAPRNLQIILCHDRRFSHKIEPRVRTAVYMGVDIISSPLSKIWPNYQRGLTGWQVLGSPNSRWIKTATTGSNEDRTQVVHLNLITGELRVDGRPLGRLPRDYIEHPTYIRLFNQVSFSLEGTQLIIQARKGNQVYELIPHNKFLEDLPFFFSEDYHHWADLNSKTVEFRPVISPWADGECPWHHCSFDSGEATLKSSNGSLLVDIHSTLFKLLSLLIGPLESGRYLHVTHSINGLIELDLPRMKLSFFLNENKQLESLNFRGQIVDDNQSAGTLFGLKTQLLLRAKNSTTQPLSQSRWVLIPDGEVEFSTHDHHVSASIRLDSNRDVDVHRYKVDKDLGRLSTDAGLTSRLFKIYLHALTSHCLPDPLTGRTGTEEALQELSQASSSSFEQITRKQAELLKIIGLLTPKREYYPSHLKRMQTTYWEDLPSLSQHYAFSLETKEVLLRANTLELFHPLEFQIRDYLASLETSDTLLKRAAWRTIIYYPPDISYGSRITPAPIPFNNVPCGRDDLAGDLEQAGQLAAWASSMAYQSWGRPIFKPYNLVSLVESWRNLNDFSKLRALSYQAAWLNVNPRSSWTSLYNLLRHADLTSNKYQLAACLAGVAFGQNFPIEFIPVLLAFATNPEFQSLDPPSQGRFKFEDEYEPTHARIKRIVFSAAYSVSLSPAGQLAKNRGESESEFRRRKGEFYHENSTRCQSELVESLMRQWSPTHEELPVQLHVATSDHAKWINTESCLRLAGEYFSSCIRNIRMKGHLRRLEVVLSSQPVSAATTFLPVNQKHTLLPTIRPDFIDPWNALHIPKLIRSRPAPDLTDIFLLPSRLSVPRRARPANDTSRLAGILAEFQQSGNLLNRQYGANLDASRKELERATNVLLPHCFSPSTLRILGQILEHCADHLTNILQQIDSALSPQTDIERAVFLSGVWPRIAPRTVLQLLSLKNRSRIDILPKWRNELLGYAQAFVDYQRTQRLLALAESGNAEGFYKELDPAGSEDPGVDDPDWLLVQIDGNFGVRSLQRQVAQYMVSPSSISNTVLQLNMGEGKSSVIVPIVASSLANSSRLIRVVVLKPLWRQMFELLVNRLSGLCNRRIYYLPFGRHIHIDAPNAEKLHSLYKECMGEGGILLAQPEHILSFKLMGIDQFLSSSPSNATVAKTLRDIQSWLKVHARDILDESDEILHVRYQLVYTVGEQQRLEDHPDRWTTTQRILDLAASQIKELHHEYPSSLLYQNRAHGQFPTLHIIPDCEVEIEKKLMSAIAKEVLDGKILNLSCNRLPLSVRNSLLEFFTNNELPYSKYEILRHECDQRIWKGLLLVRGLLACGILAFALKRKYYRVDYGLDLSRSLLAVPYRAKDIPSLRAEFGHPDVAVVLTCLSYYYQGLTEQHLDLCFKQLIKLDNPSLEYDQWVKRNDALPDTLKHLTGINIKDRQQFTERIYPHFSRNSATVDFFLSSVVFPKEAKAFPQKLATSGWDLAEGKETTNVTTGFSGTNDNQFLLPTSISQSDPAKQLSTNALVLNYLLQPENRFYTCIHDETGGIPTTTNFLEFMVKQTPEIRVLLDVGAQMLDLQNEELVLSWLRLMPNIEAAVYFNNQDELVVLRQGGTPVPLNSSPFSQRLDKCIVYLDDGHTRGTDLKLPPETRALVTLGPKVTKDRLLQGCMRMRMLGHGQSVIFAAPPEIDTQIRHASPSPIDPDAPIDTLDVLRWAMLQTCKDLQHHASHWARQGVEFHQRSQAEKEYEQAGEKSILEKKWTMRESRTLEEMYGVRSPEALRDTKSLTQRVSDIPELLEGLKQLGVDNLDDPGMDEEQEREVHHEVEEEPQTQRPLKRKAATHSLSSNVINFITTGYLPPGGSDIVPLFHPFKSSVPQAYPGWSRLLFASTDFLQTIVGSPIDSLTDYMRPVNWVVSGSAGVRVVLSPYEVNVLLPRIRNSSSVRLHVYAPRVSRSMLSFSDLQFYSIPAIPRSLAPPGPLSVAQLHLDLFAGQLYFPCYQDYLALCATLGIFIPTRDGDLNVEFESDGFVKAEHRTQLVKRHPEYSNCEFTTTPIPALKDFIGYRRKGMQYLLTHVGQILHARDLTPDNF